MVIQLQEDTASGGKSIAELLRLAKLMSAKLDLPLVQGWIEHELKGYPNGDSLPNYRFISGGQLHIHNPYYGWQLASGGDLHLWKLPVLDSVPELEKLTGENPVYLIPPVRIRLTDFSGDSDLLSEFPQRIMFPGSVFVKIIESVRDRLLDWSIQLALKGVSQQILTGRVRTTRTPYWNSTKRCWAGSLTVAS